MNETTKHSDFVVVDNPDDLYAVLRSSLTEENKPDTGAVYKELDKSPHEAGAILHCRLVITVALQSGAQGEFLHDSLGELNWSTLTNGLR